MSCQTRQTGSNRWIRERETETSQTRKERKNNSITEHVLSQLLVLLLAPAVGVGRGCSISGSGGAVNTTTAIASTSTSTTTSTTIVQIVHRLSASLASIGTILHQQRVRALLSYVPVL
jgi:hypothetical protein